MEPEKAFKKLLVKNPFYGLFCLSLPKVVTRSTNTLCIRQKGISCELAINPDFWEQHTDDEQIALLQHELGHICLQHMFISQSFSNSKIFNMAADAEVNSYIENLPEDACNAAYLSKIFNTCIDNGLGTKRYYEIIQKELEKQSAKASQPQKPCNGGQGGQGNNSSSSGSGADDGDVNDNSTEQQTSQEEPQREEENDKEDKQMYPDNVKDSLKSFDDHDTWKDFKNMPDAQKQLMQNNINSVLKQTAEQIEKTCGKIPGELVGIIEMLREKKPEIFNWKAYFRRMLGSIYDVNIKSTRRKVSKRFEGAAGIQHRKKVSILVAVDTSGSVSVSELQDFFSEIEYIYKAGARVTIVECDTRINSITEYDGKTIPKIHGRGGTDFNPPVDYYKEHKKDYASLIYFTDGECNLPRENPSGMVWVITSNGYHQDYPGKTIYIPKTA